MILILLILNTECKLMNVCVQNVIKVSGASFFDSLNDFR